MLSGLFFTRLARKDAFEIIEDDPRLSQPDHKALKAALQAHFAESLELIDVG